MTTSEAGTGGVICVKAVIRVEFADVGVGTPFPLLLFPRGGRDCSGAAIATAMKITVAKVDICIVNVRHNRSSSNRKESSNEIAARGNSSNERRMMPVRLND